MYSIFLFFFLFSFFCRTSIFSTEKAQGKFGFFCKMLVFVLHFVSLVIMLNVKYMKLIAILCLTVDVHQERISADGCRTDVFMQPMKMSMDVQYRPFYLHPKETGSFLHCARCRKTGKKETQVPLRTIACNKTQWDRTPRF